MSAWLLPLLGAAAAALLLLAVGVRALLRTSSGQENLGRAVAPVGPESLDAARRQARREALVLALALASGIAATVLMAVLGGALPRLLGLPMALAGSVGAIVGLAVFSLVPRPAWPRAEGYRSAELVPREAWSFGRQWAFVVPLVEAGVLVLGLVAAGAASSVDERGLHRVYATTGVAGWGIEGGRVVDVQAGVHQAGPFPGWYYGVPLILATLLLVGAVYWSLRRVALAPRPAGAELFGIDTELRTLRTRFVMAASSAALGIQVAGLSLMTGIVLRSAHTDPVPTPDIDGATEFVSQQPGHSIGVVLIFAGLGLAVAAFVLLFAAIGAVRDAAHAAPAGVTTA